MIIYKNRIYQDLSRHFHYEGMKKVGKIEGLIMINLYGYKKY